MRSLRNFHLLSLSVLLVTLLAFCRKADFSDVDIAEHTSDFAFPLFTTTLNLTDLLGQVLNDSLSGDTILINDDNTLTLIYSGDVVETRAANIFADFLDTTLPFPVLDTVYRVPFDPGNGITLREAFFSEGTFQLTMVNLTGQPVTGTLYIPKMLKNGMPFTIPFSADPFPAVFNSPPVPVEGYRLLTDSNTIEVRYDAFLPNGTKVKLISPTPDFPAVILTSKGLKMYYMEGYFGKYNYDLTTDTIDIDINQTELDANVKIKNPKVTFVINNDYGFPTRGVIRKLVFVGQDGNEYPLVSSVFYDDTLFDIGYPALNNVGGTVTTELTMDETNSNIAQIFNSQPTHLIYDVGGIANAEGDSNVIGFITDSSSLRLGVKVELLLEGSALNFGADQEVDLTFGDYSNLDSTRIESVEFKLVTENLTPISARLQLYFRDSLGNTIDSLFTEGPQLLMEAAPVNSEGVVTTAKRTERFIAMDLERFNRIRKSETGFLQTSFSTVVNPDGTQTPVKLLATNQTVIKMGMRIKTRW
jgi:hypothetical protein